MRSHAMVQSQEKQSLLLRARNSIAARPFVSAKRAADAERAETLAKFDFSRIPIHRGDAKSAPAKCGCESSSGSRASCEACETKRTRDAGKAVDVVDEEAMFDKPNPYAGSATIRCDGKGGYEVVLNSWATAKCGTKDCVVEHESSHIADWKAKWPTGCKDQAKGYLPKGDPPDSPLMTAAEYKAFLKESECTAHTVDLTCAEALDKEGDCKTTVDKYISLTKKQKAKWC